MINNYTLVDFVLPIQREEESNLDYAKRIYRLARKLQYLYNDFRKSYDAGTISKYEAYTIYFICENLMTMMIGLRPIGYYFIDEAISIYHEIHEAEKDEDSKLNIFTQAKKYFSTMEDPEVIKEIDNKFGEYYDFVIYAYLIMWESLRMIDEFIVNYVNYVNDYANYYDARMDHVNNPPPAFPIWIYHMSFSSPKDSGDPIGYRKDMRNEYLELCEFTEEYEKSVPRFYDAHTYEEIKYKDRHPITKVDIILKILKEMIKNNQSKFDIDPELSKSFTEK